MAVDPMELEARVRALARAIDAPEDLVPTFGWSRDGAYPFIEWTGEAITGSSKSEVSSSNVDDHGSGRAPVLGLRVRDPLDGLRLGGASPQRG